MGENIIIVLYKFPILHFFHFVYLVVPGLGLNIHVPKKGDINEQDTISMLLNLTVLLGRVITSTPYNKIG